MLQESKPHLSKIKDHVVIRIMKTFCGCTYKKVDVRPKKTLNVMFKDTRTTFAKIFLALHAAKYKFTYVDEFSSRNTVGKQYAWKNKTLDKYIAIDPR